MKISGLYHVMFFSRCLDISLKKSILISRGLDILTICRLQNIVFARAISDVSQGALFIFSYSIEQRQWKGGTNFTETSPYIFSDRRVILCAGHNSTTTIGC